MNPLEILWRDKATIYRTAMATVDNIDKPVESKVAENVKCQYSQGSVTTTDETSGAPVIKNAHKLICGVNSGIIEGDRIVVTRQDNTTVYLRVGEGFVYPMHKEFKVERDDTV